jgi:D-3-phosphoglycerate dehydrogenase
MPPQLASPLVLVTEGSDPTPLDWLRTRCTVLDAPVDSPAFAQNIASADALVVRTYTRVNESLLARAPRLKVVARGGVGLENIDVPACRRRNVEVVYSPDANTLAVGDFVFGLMLQLLRPWSPFKDKVYEAKEFKRIRDTVRGRQLNELTLGILGLGRVGRRVAHIAVHGFGMRVLYNDIAEIPLPPDLAGRVQSVDKPTLYRESDVLSLHVDMRPGNELLVGAAQLAQMKPTAILLNTSRGEVLDAAALADALRARKLADAALDVFWPEPPPPDFPLLGLDNVILTPHLAARTYTAIENMSWVVRDVMEVLEGRPPKYPAPRR